LAVQLAMAFNGEIVSADARQVYRGMDIGTSKDLNEYQTNGRSIPYHLIDVADPQASFDLAQYQKMAFEAIDDIISRKKLPILCGGSGLYLQAVVDNYQLNSIEPDKKLREKLETKDVSWLLKEIAKLDQDFFSNLNESERNNKRRLIRYFEVLYYKNNNDKEIKNGMENIGNKGEQLYDPLIIGLSWPIEELRVRIKQKLLLGLDQGMVKEVKKLHEQGLDWQRLDSFGLEYRYLAKYLQGELEYDEMREQLNLAIGQFAKRQISWFRRWEKQGININWLKNVDVKKEATQLLRDFLGRK